MHAAVKRTMTRMPSDSGPGVPPPLEVQQGFWNEWNQTWRFGEGLDPFMQRQHEFAMSVACEMGLSNPRILDVGCGIGWLGNALLPFGRVWATDLSEAAISEGRRRHPDVQFASGDFLTVDLPGTFDLVVSADSLINMYDQPACIRRIAELLEPGGTFLLMTPNREVWRRRSTLRPLGRGQVQSWRSVEAYKNLLLPYFTIEQVRTIYPGGDSGLLWWVENRYVRRGMGLLLGRRRWQSALEAAGLGMELVFVARRLPADSKRIVS
jgi:2-polyprenyl-3-methyl-5-hydroxy-6-metoxy-1,4-benzoquinol methylase